MASYPLRSKPIENVWDALGRQVAGRNYPPTNKNTLIRALTEEWDKIASNSRWTNICKNYAVKITPSCCLSEKWPIINLLDDIWILLPEVESLGEVGGRPQCDKCGYRVRTAHSIVSHDFGDNFKQQE
ncbi:hypothetical protein TNCV_3499911 [Trichonephila clavipes]|nr:hypothetical protein TNCV_3499911 [Trichonephila clavipes]